MKNVFSYRYLRTLLGVACLFSPTFASADAGFDLLVDVAWLQARLGDTDVRIVDARSREEFLAGHIPGAVNIPVEATFGPPPRTDLVGHIDQITRLFSAAGMSRSQPVVVYDSGVHKDAARLFWVFEVFGHERTSLLNGGYAGWVASGQRVSTDAVTPVPGDYVPSVQHARMATQFTTLLATRDPNIVLVDVRPLEEYAGKKSKSARKGHIPSAISIPASKNLVQHEGVTTYRPVDELQALFSELDRKTRVVTYCNKGKDAASAYFVLRNLGYNVAAYDGSWYEWGNDPDLPITGPQH